MSTRIKNLRLLGIAILVALLFNFPFISIFDKQGFTWGIPNLYFLIFLFWFLAIVCLHRVVSSKGGDT